MSYVLYKFRYKQGNIPIEQSTVEVRDRGNSALNRDAAQQLAEVWIAERRAKKGVDVKFIDAEPFVALTERPSEDAVPVNGGVKPIAARA